MTVSELNRAIQNIDDKYLELAVDSEKEIIQMNTHNNKTKILSLLLTACLVMGLGITAYAYGGEIVSRLFGWGNNLEVKTTLEDSDSNISEVIVHTDNLNEPVQIQDGRMIFIVNGESIDITGKVSEIEAFQYEYKDSDGITHLWLVGLLEKNNPEHYGYAEYLKNEEGVWIAGYSARINTEPDGQTAAEWLENFKKINEIPW